MAQLIQTKMKTRICIQCNKEFRLYFTKNKKEVSLFSRTRCLECQPLKEQIADLRKTNNKLKEENKKQCSNCKVIKDFTEFHKRKAHPVKYNHICRKCDGIHKKEIKQKQIELFKSDLKCSICGYNKCMAALDFHHLNPNEKEYGLARLIGSGSSKKRIEEELKKCVVLCSNCHRELHWNEKQNDILSRVELKTLPYHE